MNKLTKPTIAILEGDPNGQKRLAEAWWARALRLRLQHPTRASPHPISVVGQIPQHFPLVSSDGVEATRDVWASLAS